MRTISALANPGCVLALGVFATAGANATGHATYETCQAFFQRLDVAVRAARVADAQSARVRGFAYLRADRFAVSDIKPSPDSVRFDTWAERLRRLDREARTHENGNLPADARTSLGVEAPYSAGLGTSVAKCGELMLAEDLSDTKRRRALYKAAVVPSSYSTLKRAVGLYPLTSQPFLAGVGRLHRQLKAGFRENPPRQTGRLVRYAPAQGTTTLRRAEIETLLADSVENPLRVPAPQGEDLERLLQTFAPVWEVDVQTRDDHIGAPVWSAQSDVASIDTNAPTVYTHVSYARLDGQTLLQLNYVVWFPARPRDGGFDLLGGHLDGVTWRVTLGADGLPLTYDSMHNCGCYHLFVLGTGVRPKPVERYEETPLVVRVLPRTTARPLVRIASGTHYLRDVNFLTDGFAEERAYALTEYDTLRSLPYRNGTRRSLFESNGIVAGTQRGERFFFWPMGVPAPGAMRQWGHHAVVFVGERYFDDPGLIERYFDVDLGG